MKSTLDIPAVGPRRREGDNTHTVEKYGVRYWAVRDPGGELVCLTVYKKGAEEVRRRLERDGRK